MSIEFKPVVDVTEADKNKQESKKLAWVNEAMAEVKVDLKQLTYEVNPFIKKVEGKEYWEYDIDKVKDYLNKLKDITNFQDIANISWEKTRGAYTVKWIMAVQIALKAIWVAPHLSIDWVLATQKNFSSSETVKAIRKFQADNNLTVTGVPYGTTIKKLLEKLGGAVSGSVSESNVNNQNITDEASFDADPKVKGDKDKKGVPESLPNSLTFEQSAITSDVVQAWKKQAEDYFKDKNPKEYKSFSSLELANWKWIYYDPDQKDIQIGIFQNKFLQEGIVLQKDKVLFITWQRKTSEKPLFDEQIVQEGQSPQQENEQVLKLQKRATLSEKINAIWSWKISSVKAGSEKSLKELAIGDRGDLKNLENGLGELKTLISTNQEFIMSDEGLRLELTNSLNDIKSGLESKNRGWLNGTKIKERLLKEVNGLISIFSSQEKIPNYDKKQDSLATRIWVGTQGKTETPSSSVQQNVGKVNINPNVAPILNYPDLLPGSSTWTTETPDKKNQVNGGEIPQSETPTPQGKNQKDLESQKQKTKKEAEEKAKKEAEKKAQELAEQEKKAAEKRKQEEEKKKKLQEENEKKEAEKKANQESANKQQNKPSEKKETATASKEFTRDSKFEDLATLSGDASNLRFEFNKGVLQTDGNGKYILINGEKYYEYTDDESKQNPALKYFDLNRNHPKGIEIQFWRLDSGYVQPDFSFVPEK